MGTFIKTFVVCLILALGYLVYRYVGVDSFSPSLKLSDNNPIFSVSKPAKEDNFSQPEEITTENPAQEETQEPVTAKDLNKKYTHTCYFYSVNGKLIPVTRNVEAPLTLENTIILLLKGPLISEDKKGIYSEIPGNVSLIDVKRKGNSIIVNLTPNFGKGGGSESVENRLKQLSATVKKLAPGKDVYLYINGQEVEYLGGEGVYVKQPL